MNMRRLTCSIIACTLALCFASTPGAHAGVPGCAQTPSTGGDWPVFGHDHSNTRSQDQEKVVSPANVGTLAAKWTFNTAPLGGGGIDGTPVEADGCIFVGTEAGSIVALNADNGALAWTTKASSGVFSSLAVADGKVFANESITAPPYSVGPRVVALDEQTGAQLWETIVNDFPGSDLYASPSIYDGMVITGIGANSIEGNPDFHGSIVFLDENDGHIIHRTWTIPPEVWDEGYSGGGVWGTPVFDEANGYAYTGTGNPFNSNGEYGTTNAIIKVDVDRNRTTFGDIVGTYKGQQDQYVASERQTCQIGNSQPQTASLHFFTCEMLDVDFGASPNLFTDHGRLIVGAQQKSGVYHAIDAGTMAPMWTQLVGTPILVTGGSSTAVANGMVYGNYNPPSWQYALSTHDGSRMWTTPHTGVDDARHYEPSSVANGVVYMVDGNGVLNALDATSGMPLLIHRMSDDLAGATVSTQSGGVSIARNMVFVAAGQYVIAYHTA